MKDEGGRMKEEGGRRKDEGGRKKEVPTPRNNRDMGTLYHLVLVKDGHGLSYSSQASSLSPCCHT